MREKVNGLARIIEMNMRRDLMKQLRRDMIKLEKAMAEERRRF